MSLERVTAPVVRKLEAMPLTWRLVTILLVLLLAALMATSLAISPGVRAYAREAMGALSKQEFLVVWGAVTRVPRPRPGYRIEHPLLLTHGDQDRTGTISRSAPAWAARDPRARYEVIPHARHNANQDSPAFFNRVLVEFLVEHAPAGRAR